MAGMTSIGFVGLGHMGGNIAARFLAAGHPVYGTERNRAHAQGLMQDDVQWCASSIVLALDEARRLRVPLPSAAAADELLTVARALGYEHRDLAALFEVLGRIAGIPSTP
jgi:3-hydroxyisobutyrate dehydrogenase-like beta-hydroxyacid dehydrogenase